MYTKTELSNNLSIMDNLEYKELLLEKVEEGIVYGYASVKNIIDGAGDVCTNGCYVDLDKTLRDGFICNSHDHDEPLGYFVRAEEDEKGLWVEFKFHSTSDAQDLYTLIKERIDAGKTVKMSIGYKTLESERGMFEGQPVRFLTQIFVAEVSITLLPCNTQADVMGMKTRTQECMSIVDSVNGYKTRLEEIYALKRGDKWVEETNAECERIYEAVLALKTWANELGHLDDQAETLDVEAVEEKTNNELELAKAKAQAVLAR